MFSSIIFRKMSSTPSAIGMNLKEIVKKLEIFAPLHLAGSWDNVGLLIEPSGEKIVKKIFLTNDLTEPVMEESIKVNTDMIFSYHPPIFRPLKRLTSSSWKVGFFNFFFFKCSLFLKHFYNNFNTKIYYLYVSF